MLNKLAAVLDYLLIVSLLTEAAFVLLGGVCGVIYGAEGIKMFTVPVFLAAGLGAFLFCVLFCVMGIQTFKE